MTKVPGPEAFQPGEDRSTACSAASRSKPGPATVTTSRSETMSAGPLGLLTVWTAAARQAVSGLGGGAKRGRVAADPRRGERRPQLGKGVGRQRVPAGPSTGPGAVQPRALRVLDARAAGMVVIDGTEQGNGTDAATRSGARSCRTWLSAPVIAAPPGSTTSMTRLSPAHRRGGQGHGALRRQPSAAVPTHPPARAANSGRSTGLVVTSVRAAQVTVAPPLWAERAGSDRARERSAR